MAEIMQLPDTYVSERELKVPTREKNTVLNVAYGGIFQKGYVGIPIPIKNDNDLRRILGGVDENTKGSFHMVKQMLKATNRLLVSRAFEKNGTKSAYANVLIPESQFTYKWHLDRSTYIPTTNVDCATLVGDQTLDTFDGSNKALGILIDDVRYDVDLDTATSGTDVVDLINVVVGEELTASLNTNNELVLKDNKTGRHIKAVDPLVGTSAINDIYSVSAPKDAYGYTRHYVSDGSTQVLVKVININTDESGKNSTMFITESALPFSSESSLSMLQYLPNSTTSQSMSVIEYHNTASINESFDDVDFNANHSIESNDILLTKSIKIDGVKHIVEFVSSVYIKWTGDEQITQRAGTNTILFNVFSMLNTVYPLDDNNNPISNIEKGESINFVSYSNIYGESTGLYDINDDGFNDRLKSLVGTLPNSIIAISNSAGKWGNDITVKLYGSEISNISSSLKRVLNGRVLKSHELLCLVSDGKVTEKMVLSIDPSKPIDEDGSQYYIETKTKLSSKLITLFANFDITDASSINMEFKLENGADGKITMNDVADSYKVFVSETVDTPIVMSGTGVNTLDELKILNNGINDILLKKDKKIDTIGLFNVPYYGIFDTSDIYSNLIKFYDRGAFNIGIDLDKHRLFSTYITVEDTENNGNDIILPVTTVVLANIVNTIKTHGRSKSASGITRGVIGGYKKLLYAPFDKTDANELYIRKMNPIQAIGESKYYINADQTSLLDNSPYKNASTRMLANMIESELKYKVETFRFEDNTPTDRSLLRDIIDNYLKPFKTNRQIVDYTIDTERDIQEELITTDIKIWYKAKAKSIHLIFYASTKID